MTTPAKKTYRKRRLFPRTVEDVVREATKPMMDKQGKLYSALLRDWSQIVGAERAAVTRPARLQFATGDSVEATLHLDVRPAVAPEFAYITGQIIEQCARYFGYRAVTRIVLHATHGVFDDKKEAPVTKPRTQAPAPVASDAPDDIADVLARIGAHVASGVVKKD